MQLLKQTDLTFCRDIFIYFLTETFRVLIFYSTQNSDQMHLTADIMKDYIALQWENMKMGVMFSSLNVPGEQKSETEV